MWRILENFLRINVAYMQMILKWELEWEIKNHENDLAMVGMEELCYFFS